MSTTPPLAPPQSFDSATAAGNAFDQIAAQYDEDFTASLIGRLQREHVWRQLDGLFPPGARILDLGCGAAADAIHLARRGCRIHAVDASAKMIAVADRKVAAAGLAPSITTEVRAMEGTWSKHSGPSGDFDGAISNFGALNCVAELRPVANTLSRIIRPGGALALCLISRFCLWETVSYSFQGRFAKAARRWIDGGRGAACFHGSQPFAVYYHSLREVRKAFEPEFHLTARCGIGLLVPPTYLETQARRVPGLVKFAARVDHAVGRWLGFRAIADHTLLIFRRGRRP